MSYSIDPLLATLKVNYTGDRNYSIKHQDQLLVEAVCMMRMPETLVQRLLVDKLRKMGRLPKLNLRSSEITFIPTAGIPTGEPKVIRMIPLCPVIDTAKVNYNGDGSYKIIFNEELLNEVARKAKTSPDLASRVFMKEMGGTGQFPHLRPGRAINILVSSYETGEEEPVYETRFNSPLFTALLNAATINIDPSGAYGVHFPRYLLDEGVREARVPINYLQAVLMDEYAARCGFPEPQTVSIDPIAPPFFMGPLGLQDQNPSFMGPAALVGPPLEGSLDQSKFVSEEDFKEAFWKMLGTLGSQSSQTTATEETKKVEEEEEKSTTPYCSEPSTSRCSIPRPPSPESANDLKINAVKKLAEDLEASRRALTSPTTAETAANKLKHLGEVADRILSPDRAKKINERILDNLEAHGWTISPTKPLCVRILMTSSQKDPSAQQHEGLQSRKTIRLMRKTYGFSSSVKQSLVKRRQLRKKLRDQEKASDAPASMDVPEPSPPAPQSEAVSDSLAALEEKMSNVEMKTTDKETKEASEKSSEPLPTPQALMSPVKDQKAPTAKLENQENAKTSFMEPSKMEFRKIKREVEELKFENLKLEETVEKTVKKMKQHLNKKLLAEK